MNLLGTLEETLIPLSVCKIRNHYEIFHSDIM